MAYGNYLAAVPFEQIIDLRQNPASLLRPSQLEVVSHLVASWIKTQPLGRLLGQALDGGEPLSSDLWHPLRPPIVHVPVAVPELLAAIRDALRAATAVGPSRDTGRFSVDIDKVLDVFEYAVDHGQAVVSILDPPMDEERAAKVRIPLAIGL